MQQRISTEIATSASVARDAQQKPLLVLPDHWSGVPLGIFPLPCVEERGPSHAADPMLFLVLSGYSQRKYRYNSNVIDLETKPGGIELKGRDYQREWARWDGTPGFTVGVRFSAPVVNRLLRGVSDFNIATKHEFFDPKIQWLVNELVSEARQSGPNGGLYSESLSCALLGYLAKHHGNQRGFDQYSGKLSPGNRRRIIDYIEANLGEELSVSRMAEDVDLSPHYFSRCFTASFGMPPHRYVLQRRIEAAQRLMLMTEKSFAEIAVDLGFCSHAHLTRAFRQVTGITPKVLRRSKPNNVSEPG